MSSPSKIAKILVQAVGGTGELLEFCRLAAKELSNTVKPLLDQNNVRLIGIGFDSRFVKPFVQEKYFDGELYIDADKQCYSALEYQRFSFCDLLRMMFSKTFRDAYSKSKGMGISGDMKGDGFQNGGTLVVAKGGKLLFEHRQLDVAEHISPDDILKALKIEK